MMSVDVLIVGAGPAGAALASFLASYGIKGLIVSKESSPTVTPKAHYLSMASLECFRDIGLESELRELGIRQEALLYHRIAATMAGQEFSRAFIFGNDAKRHGDYFDASPGKPLDIQQGVLESTLLRKATEGGHFKLRFDTKFVGFEQTESGVESTLEDLITKEQFVVKSRYLCGADGVDSSIRQQLQLQTAEPVEGGPALYVEVEADLSHLVAECPSTMHTITIPEDDPCSFCTFAVVRPMPSPNEWLFVCLAPAGVSEITATKEEIRTQIQKLIGDNRIPVTVKRTSIWRIKEGCAERYSRENVFCLGDAVHQQPPHNGLGWNTGIQDAYNLAWKLASVLEGSALPSLLETYTAERQPVGKYILQRAQATIQIHVSIFVALGVFESDRQKRLQLLDKFNQDTPEGAEQRAAFQQAIDKLDEERHSIGSEMNQLYRSRAVYHDDEQEVPRAPSIEAQDTLYYHQTTHPGSRLPHAWLKLSGALGARKPLISTQDLAGHGRFTIFTGIGGKAAWAMAVDEVKNELGANIEVFSLGWGQDYEDPFFSWTNKRGVHEKGAVLVRPDRTVAWRSVDWDETVSSSKLLQVMRSILGFAEQGDVDLPSRSA